MENNDLDMQRRIYRPYVDYNTFCLCGGRIQCFINGYSQLKPMCSNCGDKFKPVKKNK